MGFIYHRNLHLYHLSDQLDSARLPFVNNFDTEFVIGEVAATQRVFAPVGTDTDPHKYLHNCRVFDSDCSNSEWCDTGLGYATFEAVHSLGSGKGILTANIDPRRPWRHHQNPLRLSEKHCVLKYFSETRLKNWGIEIGTATLTLNPFRTSSQAKYLNTGLLMGSKPGDDRGRMTLSDGSVARLATREMERKSADAIEYAVKIECAQTADLIQTAETECPEDMHGINVVTYGLDVKVTITATPPSDHDVTSATYGLECSLTDYTSEFSVPIEGDYLQPKTQSDQGHSETFIIKVSEYTASEKEFESAQFAECYVSVVVDSETLDGLETRARFWFQHSEPELSAELAAGELAEELAAVSEEADEFEGANVG